jgi:hypothetical protein
MSEQMNFEQESTASEGEPSAEFLLESLGKTESKTSGRMRLRLHTELRNPEIMAKLNEYLDNHPDIHEVKMNARTGSVVIKHDPEHDSHKLVSEAIGEAELLAEVVFEIPDEDGGEEPSKKLDQQLADLAYDVDRAIYRSTGENMHLGLVIPASIAGIGIAQIALYGIGLELLPGPVLLWIAYDIYRRIGKEPPFVTRDKAMATQEPDLETTITSIGERAAGHQSFPSDEVNYSTPDINDTLAIS